MRTTRRCSRTSGPVRTPVNRARSSATVGKKRTLGVGSLFSLLSSMRRRPTRGGLLACIERLDQKMRVSPSRGWEARNRLPSLRPTNTRCCNRGDAASAGAGRAITNLPRGLSTLSMGLYCMITNEASHHPKDLGRWLITKAKRGLSTATALPRARTHAACPYVTHAPTQDTQRGVLRDTCAESARVARRSSAFTTGSA